MDAAPGTSSAAYDILRQDARAQLARWTPPDAAQERLRGELLAHLDAHEDAMAKAGPPAHFTGGVLVVHPERDRVLLTLHRRARQWFQFGGHFEVGDASVLAAATREAREESGLAGLTVIDEIVHLDRHTLVGDFGACKEHLDIRYCAVADDPDAVVVSSESIDVRWWRVDALPSGTERDLRPLVAAALRVSRQ